MKTTRYSTLLRRLAARKPPYMPQIRNKLVTKARALELGMAAPKLHGIFETPRQIDLARLPARVVFKRHMDASRVLCLRDGLDQRGRRWNTASVRRWFHKTLRSRSSSGEPYKVFAEEYVRGQRGRVPLDFKFFVIGNAVHSIQVDHDRYGRHKQIIYTRDWERTQHYNLTQRWDPRRPADPRPERLAEMIGFCEDFSRTWPAPTMRVDLFVLDGEPLFCEAGVFHRSGIPMSAAWDLEMGRAWQDLE